MEQLSVKYIWMSNFARQIYGQWSALQSIYGEETSAKIWDMIINLDGFDEQEARWILPPINAEARRESIAKLAYSLWESQDQSQSQSDHYWLTAEREVDSILKWFTPFLH
jgi:hypothetical protein